ncbi:GNAT family N-acetyltransferase [Thalassotalea ponticola]|uniref:GNAT family N-acetyltransferase n=1 Tax=Thalassotalea ponticola TaxID=1523392 RepID=UPI0025B3BDE2|nr:GNAT family N-acetyltransferase [Thalassotalea ponticola]MDN3652419.1 GNAT family N-acetyltransferase [Thalassotalea ponticola]
MNLSIRIIDSLSQLPSYRQSWEAVRQTGNIGFCCSFDWIHCWVKHYLSAKDKLAIAMVYDGQTPVAVMPTYLRSYQQSAELFFIGQGEAEHEEVASEFQDIIIAPGYRQRVFELLHDFITQIDNLAAVEFRQVLDSSTCVAFMSHYQSLAQTRTVTHRSQRYSLQVNNFVDSIPHPNTRRKLLKSLADYQLECQLPQSQADAQRMLNQLITLHQKAWQAKQKRGAFSSQRFIDFHQQYIADKWQQGKVLLFALSHRTDVVGVFYGIIDDTLLSYYQSGLDLTQVNNLGYAMHAQAIRLAKQRGLTRYDLMAASTNSYKRRITNTTEPMLTVRYQFSRRHWRDYLTEVKSKLWGKIKEHAL